MYVEIELGEFLGERSLDRRKAEPRLGIQIEGCDPQRDRKALSLPLRTAEQLHELVDVRCEGLGIVAVARAHLGPECAEHLEGILTVLHEVEDQAIQHRERHQVVFVGLICRLRACCILKPRIFIAGRIVPWMRRPSRLIVRLNLKR